MITEFCGQTLRNPLLLAPGPFSDDLYWIERFVNAGIGGVVLKTAVGESLADMRRWVRPRYHLPFGSKGNFVLYSFEQAFRGSISDYAELIRETKRLGVPIIASLLATNTDDWIEMGLRVQEAGAVGVELDISCPHADEDSTDTEFRAYLSVAESLLDVLSIPIIPKLKPHMDSDVLARELGKIGIRAVTACNRMSGIDVDLERMRPVLHGGFAGFGGPWSKYLVFGHVAKIRKATDLEISASGGVTTGEDLVKYVSLGATTVQALSVFMLNGIDEVARILQETDELLRKMGVKSLSEIRGRAADNLVDPKKIERDQKISFRIDGKKCVNCGICIRVCRYLAIETENDRVSVNPDRCDGCGLCAQICPMGCIGEADS